MSKQAGERLAVARAALSAITKQLEEAEAKRRSALLNDNDTAAAFADRELAELRPAAKRLADKIELLLPVAAAEREQQDWPDDLPAARDKLVGMERRREVLSRKLPRDRSAVDQTELDALTYRIPAMSDHIALLERIQA